MRISWMALLFLLFYAGVDLGIDPEKHGSAWATEPGGTQENRLRQLVWEQPEEEHRGQPSQTVYQLGTTEGGDVVGLVDLEARTRGDICGSYTTIVVVGQYLFEREDVQKSARLLDVSGERRCFREAMLSGNSFLIRYLGHLAETEEWMTGAFSGALARNRLHELVIPSFTADEEQRAREAMGLLIRSGRFEFASIHIRSFIDSNFRHSQPGSGAYYFWPAPSVAEGWLLEAVENEVRALANASRSEAAVLLACRWHLHGREERANLPDYFDPGSFAYPIEHERSAVKRAVFGIDGDQGTNNELPPDLSVRAARIESLAELFRQEGHLTDALELLETVAQAVPDRATLQLRLADTLWDLGRADEAKERYGEYLGQRRGTVSSPDADRASRRLIEEHSGQARPDSSCSATPTIGWEDLSTDEEARQRYLSEVRDYLRKGGDPAIAMEHTSSIVREKRSDILQLLLDAGLAVRVDLRGLIPLAGSDRQHLRRLFMVADVDRADEFRRMLRYRTQKDLRLIDLFDEMGSRVPSSLEILSRQLNGAPDSVVYRLWRELYLTAPLSLSEPSEREQNESPLFAAVEHDREFALRAMLAGGADPNPVNEDFQTPLDFARRLEKTKAIEILEAYGGTTSPIRPSPALTTIPGELKLSRTALVDLPVVVRALVGK